METTMEKIEVNPLILNRWSPRAFSDKSISEQQRLTMFEAARLAPSNYNLQPWRFIYSHQADKKQFSQILDVLWDLNQTWAQNAPLLVVAVAEMTNPYNGDPNPHAWHDIGLAMANMVLQAEELGIKAHQMGGFDAQKARENLKISDHFEPVTVTAFGYLGNPDQLPDKFRADERQPSERKPREVLFFPGTWNPDVSYQ